MEIEKKEDQIKKLLSQGADERIFLNELGVTKYGTSLINKDIFNRGSCTASPATSDDIVFLNKILAKNYSETEWIEQLEERTCQLKDLLNNDHEDLFEIFYAPSGTDLFYYPIILGKLMQPGKKLINLVTCKEELGSGTPFASEARYYSNFNQFGDNLGKGDQILESKELETIFFDARSEQGFILNHEERIKDIINNNPNNPIIVNLVYGSKSGISDNIMIIDKVDADNVIWCIDMCQLRHQKDIIRMFLKKNSMVMITGSKFYQAPPFCAALLIPHQIYKKLQETEYNAKIEGFKNIFSKYDFPVGIRNKFNFPDKFNISNHLRWILTIREIQEYFKIEINKTESKIESWNQKMMQTIKKYSEFELMPSQEKTNKSIISFRLKIKDSYLNHKQLKKLHREIVTTDYNGLFNFKNIFIGQPVAYTNKSFLRLAIGSKNVRNFVKNREEDFIFDQNLIEIIRNKLYKLYGN